MRFFTSFEKGDTSEFDSASGTVQSSVKRSGTYAGRVDDNQYFLKTLPSFPAMLYVGGWWRWSITPTGWWWYIMLGNGNPGDNIFSIRALGGNLRIDLTSGGNYTSTNAPLVNANQWYYIELQYYLATPGWFKIYVDGVLSLSQSGIDTDPTGMGWFELVRFQGINGGAGNYAYLDDIYASDGSPDYGIKVSKPGKSITSVEPRDYVLHSGLGSVIIYEEDEVSVNIAGSSSTKSTINFTTLGYIPLVYVFVELTPGSGKWYQCPFTFSIDAIDTESSYIETSGTTNTAVEDDNFYITLCNKTAGAITVKYHYYIFANLG